MNIGDRRAWRQQVGAALRPEAGPDALSRRAVGIDVLLAGVLTVVAVVVATRYPDAGPIKVDAHPGPDWPPPPPSLPMPPRIGEPMEYTEYTPASAPWPLVVLSTLPLVARRRCPLAAFAVVLIAAVAIGEDDASWITVLACVVGAYSAVVHSRYRARAMAVLGVAAVLAGVAFRDSPPVLPGWSSPGVVLLVAGALAGLVRFWRRQLATSREQYTRLQDAQEAATRRAVEEERARIATELHDVVTHNVSVMVIQAGAARTVMDLAPERSKEALLAVEAGGRAAMAELRHVMGLLAASHHERPDGLEPQPGLDRLDALVERVRAAGTPVRVSVSLPADPLPPGVDLAAYRVVQEALTNTIKHAPGAAASVTVRCVGERSEILEIEIVDTGGVRERTSMEGNGRGLVGLRERLAVYDGELTTGPTLTGGFRVKAGIPWRTS